MSGPTDLTLLLDLPGRSLVLLAAGYMAYRIAYVGRDRNDRPIDILFKVAVFALCAKFGAMLTDAISLAGDVHPAWEIAAHCSAVLAAVLSAAIWRKWLERAWFVFLRHLGIVMSDGHLTAWGSIAARTEKVEDLVVRKKDGTALWCADAGLTSGLPFSPCLLGEDGSVALYVTHTKAKGKDWLKLDQPSRLTFVPASEISEIEGSFIGR